MKNQTKQIVVTKEGKISKTIINMLNNCRFDIQQNKIYTGYYSGSGRFTSSQNANILPILRAQGYKFTIGNDAPKGGIKGDYFKVSKTAFNFLLNLKK